METLTLPQLRESFLAVLSIRELQLNTISVYTSIYDSFIRYSLLIKIHPADISHEQILFYLSKIKSESTRRQAKGMLTNLYGFVLSQGFKMYGVPNPKRHHQVPDYFTTYELQQIFNSIKNIKQRTIMKMEYACALRVNEVCKIKKSDFLKKWDVNLKKNVYDLRIDGKGGNVEVIPVPDETVSEIAKYYSQLNERDKNSEYLFRGQFGLYYSSRSVSNRLTKAMNDCGIKKYGNHKTHFLRISRGTHLLIAGVDISFVQKLLRHKSIKTTQQYYSGIKTDEMRVVFSKADKFLFDNLQAEALTQKQLSA